MEIVKIDTNPIQGYDLPMDYSKKSREELTILCKELHIKGYSGKKKEDIIKLLNKGVIEKESVSKSDSKSIRYLGCKQKLIPYIQDTIQLCKDALSLERPCILFDAFSGTGTVSSHFSKQGYLILACDLLHSSSILTKCMVGFSKNLCFEKLGNQVDSMEAIDHVLGLLNQCESVGYITKTYTPVGNRMYFTEQNGKRIDGMREQIHQWFQSNQICENEHDFLLGCLLVAVSLVSNTAGTYGAYNKIWDKRAEKEMRLTNPFHTSELTHTILKGDTQSFLEQYDYDILYLDPPYNERQYGSYYHLLETIIRNDEPMVKGVTGVRNFSDTKSDFCNRKFAESALETMVKKTRSKFVVMSYNNEGILSKETIVSILEKYGIVSCEEIPYDRYNRVKEKGSSIVEYLFTLKIKETVTMEELLSQVPTEPLSQVPTEPAPVLPWYNTLHNLDCLEGMKYLPDKSVDLILTDLPYGLTECKWDSVIPLTLLWESYRRIIKPTGAIVLFAQQPFTSILVSSNLDMFKYSLVWKKTKTGNFAQAPYRFLCEHEDILVFSYGKVSKNGVPRMNYFPQGTQACHIPMKGKNGKTSHREGRSTQKDYVQTVTNYPKSILEFGNEGKPLHPTQKPLDLCKYLIQTYSQEGDVVLDSCMGSGTTAVAAIQTHRCYVGYEKEKEYYEIGMKRIQETKELEVRIDGPF